LSILPDVTDDTAKELSSVTINTKQWFYLEWLLRGKKVNIVKYLSKDELDAIFRFLHESCKKSILAHLEETKSIHKERKEFLYRAGIWKTVDVIFCTWWYSISNLKKTLIYCGSLAILASIVVGLCYQLTPANLIV